MSVLNSLLSNEYNQILVNHRRYLHMHPEPSFHEENTQRYITSVLHRCGVEYKVFDDRFSIVAHIKGRLPGRRIAFRADIDALRIEEATGVEYASVNKGVMHACGHDGHTAVLLTLAEFLSANKNCLCGEAVLIFQHAEENFPGGAGPLIQKGVLDGIDFIFGMHLWPLFNTGEIAYSENVLMASPDAFSVQFYGPGGHGSEPHKSRDVVMAAAALVMQLQSAICSNKAATDPGVLTVCHLQAGTTYNAIPDSSLVRGTIRSCSEAVRYGIFSDVKHIAKCVAEMYEVEHETEIMEGYPPLVNDATVINAAMKAIGTCTNYTLLKCAPVMAGEDFSQYLKIVPGAFFFVGCKNQEYSDRLHSSTYMIDEKSMMVALEAFISICSFYLMLK